MSSPGSAFEEQKKKLWIGHWSKNFLSILSNQMSRRATYVWGTEQNQEKVGAGMSSLSYRYVPRSRASTAIPVCLASSRETYARKTRLLWSLWVTVARLTDKRRCRARSRYRVARTERNENGKNLRLYLRTDVRVASEISRSVGPVHGSRLFSHLLLLDDDDEDCSTLFTHHKNTEDPTTSFRGPHPITLKHCYYDIITGRRRRW